MKKRKDATTENEDQDSIKNIGQHRKFLGLRLSALIELVIFFVVVLLIAWFFKQEDLFFSICPHPFWIIVILLSAQYGTTEGILAAAVSTIVLLFGKFPDRDIVQDQFQYFLYIAKEPILWFVSAVILGEVRNRHIRERDKLRTVAIEAEEKEQTISKSYNELKNVKEKLDIRLASEMQTALMAYESFKKLEVLDKNTILKGGMDLLQNFLSPEKSSLYLLEKGHLNRIAERGWSVTDKYQTTFGSDTHLFREIVGKSRIVSVVRAHDRTILGDEGILAAPIKSIQPLTVFGMIKVEKLPFTQLRMNTLEMLRLVGEWIGTAYASYLAKSEAERARYIDAKSQLLTTNYLQFQKTFLINLGRRLKVNVALFHIEMDTKETLEESARIEVMQSFRRVISQNLRSTDQAFEYQKKGLEFALLVVNTSREGCEKLKEKMSHALEAEFHQKYKISYRIEMLYEEEARKSD